MLGVNDYEYATCEWDVVHCIVYVCDDDLRQASQVVTLLGWSLERLCVLGC